MSEVNIIKLHLNSRETFQHTSLIFKKCVNLKLLLKHAAGMVFFGDVGEGRRNVIMCVNEDVQACVFKI